MGKPSSPKNYVWELGIDWELASGFANSSYMPGDFCEILSIETKSPPLRPVVNGGDTILFQILDLGVINKDPAPMVETIESFTINPQIAAGTTTFNPLSTLQPLVVKLADPVKSPYFDTTNSKHFPCWQATAVVQIEAVPLPYPARFLLEFFVQATGPGGILRTFCHDPEMIVGST